jgi:hypothetical protein
MVGDLEFWKQVNYIGLINMMKKKINQVILFLIKNQHYNVNIQQ